MPSEPNYPAAKNISEAGGVPPPLPASEPPAIGIPPLLLRESNFPAATGRQFLASLLSLCLALFLADAVISFVDDTFALVAGIHILLGLRIIVGFFAMLLALVVYVLMAITPAIPKKLFVPLALFYLATQLAGFPICFLYARHMPQINCLLSLAQVAFGLWVLYCARGGLKFDWLLVPLVRLQGGWFSWRNLIGFSLANVFGLLPVVMIYLFLCAAGLVDHFTDGFMALHPGGFTVQARKYVRDDGKTIQLFPMSHVAEGDFYRDISQTFPTNSIILMEGVTDERHLLKHQINYQRMARTLGLAEQHEKFEPTRGEIVMADVDVNQFTTNTLDLLNLVILIHAQGLDAGTIHKLMEYSMSPDFQEQLFDDLLRKRNQHLLEQIQSHLPETEHLVVPWGVAHMPGIAREIQKFGFRLSESQEYEVIRFHFFRNAVAPGKLK